jgi:hypothetical protein
VTEPRNWDRELADIDHAIAKQGSAPVPAPVPPPVPGARPTAPAAAGPVRRRSVALTWFWVLLAVALAVALLVWPYQRACGLQLIFYLGAAAVTAVIAVLGAVASWSHRRGLAHVVSLAVLLVAGFVALREVLPRVGYARTSRTWMCPTEPAAPARTSPTAPTGTTPSIAPTGTAPSAPAADAPAPR